MLGNLARSLVQHGSGIRSPAGPAGAAVQLLQKRFLNIHEYQVRGALMQCCWRGGGGRQGKGAVGFCRA